MAYDMLDELYTMCDRLTEALVALNAKFKGGKGILPAGDLDYADKLLHSIKSLKTTAAMEEAYDEDEYSGAYYGNSRSFRGDDREHSGRSERGSSGRGRKRDSMGRYSRDYFPRGYSRAAAKDEMIDNLRDLMDETSDDRERQEIQTFISKMQNMR